LSSGEPDEDRLILLRRLADNQRSVCSRLRPDAERVGGADGCACDDAQGGLGHVTLVLNFSDELRRRPSFGK
jgi:hypothetical protein